VSFCILFIISFPWDRREVVKRSGGVVAGRITRRGKLEFRISGDKWEAEVKA